MNWHLHLLSVCLFVAFALSGGHRVARGQIAPEVTKNSLDMKLVLIPTGEFMMGAEEDRIDTLNAFKYCDPKRIDGELPRHKVRVTKSFYMGQHEVTLGEFLKFYHDASYKLECERDGEPSWGYNQDGTGPVKLNVFRPWHPLAWENSLDQPVIYVSWNDAAAFCEWLSKKEAKKYRLPTEAEWEYACRAGSKDRFHFGDDTEELVRYGNAADQDYMIDGIDIEVNIFENGKATGRTAPFPYLSRRDGYRWTAPVGKFKPNAFGLYDMHGNVSEWCADWYDEKYYEKSITDDPLGPTEGLYRVVRGGPFNRTPEFFRCAFRYFVRPVYRDYRTGFRVVCEK